MNGRPAACQSNLRHRRKSQGESLFFAQRGHLVRWRNPQSAAAYWLRFKLIACCDAVSGGNSLSPLGGAELRAIIPSVAQANQRTIVEIGRGAAMMRNQRNLLADRKAIGGQSRHARRSSCRESGCKGLKIRWGWHIGVH